LKEIIIVFGAKIFDRQPAKQKIQNFYLFFSLQDNPTLLVPWMVYIIIYQIANTYLYIFIAEALLASDFYAVLGYVLITVAVIYVCK